MRRAQVAGGLALVLVSAGAFGLTRVALKADDEAPARRVNPTAGFTLHGPRAVTIRAADGPLVLHVTPRFLNWEPMPAKAYRFTAHAVPVGGDAAAHSVEGKLGHQPAGRSTHALPDRSEVLWLELEPGEWHVVVAMHDAGLTGRRTVDGDLAAILGEEWNGAVLQCHFLRVTVE